MDWKERKRKVLNESIENPVQGFSRLLEIVTILRGSEGCQWDRELTPLKLRQNIVEEAFELIDGINNNNKTETQEELGDVFLVLTMLGRVLEDEKTVNLKDVFHQVCEKLIRRHPHVFKDQIDLNSKEILHQWEEIKKQEKDPERQNGFLHKIGQGLHPLDKAFKYQKKVSMVGFDWPSVQGVLDKIYEELKEVEEEIQSHNSPGLEEELGDLLFSVINLIRFKGYSPTLILEKNLLKFKDRFESMESALRFEDLELSPENFQSMEKYWTAHKNNNE